MKENLITQDGAKVITETGEDLYRVEANGTDVSVAENVIVVLEGDNSQATINGVEGSVFNEGDRNCIKVEVPNGIVKNEGKSATVKVSKHAAGSKILNMGEHGNFEINCENASVYSNARKSKVKLSGCNAEVYVLADDEDMRMDVSGESCKLKIEGENVKLNTQGRNINAEISGENYTIHHNASEGEYFLKSYGYMYLHGCRNTVSLDSGAKNSQLNVYKGTNKIRIACDYVQLTTHGIGNNISILGNNVCGNVHGDCTSVLVSGEGNRLTCFGENQRIVVCGRNNKLSLNGEYSTVYWDGDGDVMFLQEGSWLTISEWKVQDSNNLPAIPIARNHYIDGVEMKTGVVYHVEDGKLIETNKKSINNK